jgi:hypothetical protein
MLSSAPGRMAGRHGEVSMQQDAVTPAGAGFRRAPSDHGAQWWSSAWRLLFDRGAAGVWIGMVLVATLIYFLLSRFPLVGWIAGHAAWFTLAGGLMIAARKTDEGTPPDFKDLFAGFGPSLGPLVVGAVLVVACTMVVFAVAALVATTLGISAALSGVLNDSMQNWGALLGIGAAALLLALFTLALLVPIAMAAWLAPALIVLKGRPPVESLKQSLAASWGNLGAMTVYGLLWIIFALLASLPLMLGWLVLAPLMVLSSYAAYKDLFEAS